MLYEPTEVEVGQVVHLYPHTHGASPACHRLLTVKVMRAPADTWPYVVVGWEENNQLKWERVHRDNIKKRPTAVQAEDKRQGDSVGSGGSRTPEKWQRRLTVGRPVANAEDQMELF